MAVLHSGFPRHSPCSIGRFCCVCALLGHGHQTPPRRPPCLGAEGPKCDSPGWSEPRERRPGKPRPVLSQGLKGRNSSPDPLGVRRVSPSPGCIANRACLLGVTLNSRTKSLPKWGWRDAHNQPRTNQAMDPFYSNAPPCVISLAPCFFRHALMSPGYSHNCDNNKYC